jgi:hypothetical protein
VGEFPLSLGDGFAVEPGDASDLADAAASPKSGQQSREQAANPLVGGSKQAVDQPVQPSRTPERMLATSWARALMTMPCSAILSHDNTSMKKARPLRHTQRHFIKLGKLFFYNA